KKVMLSCSLEALFHIARFLADNICLLQISQENTKLRRIMALVLVLITYVLVTSRYPRYRSSQKQWYTMHANSALVASLLPDRVWPVFLRFHKISSGLSSHRRSCSHVCHRHRRGREGKKRSDQVQGSRAQQEVGVEAMKQKRQMLSLEAHDCANAIPDLSNMIKAVQGQDLKLKCYEEMDKRKKLYNIIQETKGFFLSMPTLNVVSISVYLHSVGKHQPHCNKVYKSYPLLFHHACKFAMRKNKFVGSNK
ncbi:hypothetical protein ACJX0J_007158, partial [Zea mays]